MNTGGAVTGSPISSILADLYMEDFEVIALNTSPHSQVCGKDMLMTPFVVIKSAYKNEFLDHINSIDEGIQFTAENTRADCSMPFLDTLVIPQPDDSLTTTLFRKPTHTDQYLQSDSYHAISVKYSMIKLYAQPHSIYRKTKNICRMS